MSKNKTRRQGNGGYIRLHCERCGTTWEVYGTTMQHEDARKCPCCNAKVSQHAWRLICDADDAVTAAQYALTAPDAPRFMVDFIDRSIYPVDQRSART